MFGTRIKLLAAMGAIIAAGFPSLWARDLPNIRITFPTHSELTLVQRLNRQGVDAVRKHQYDKAEAIFYKAYLYDAADPFTLNNLGYIAELKGNLVRAQKFYALAGEQDCNAVVSLSNAKQLEGKPMTYALTSLKNLPMRVNRMNVEAIELLSQGRNFEADAVLRQALVLDPQNLFTLNNLGVAEEATGNDEGALKYYDQVADAGSSEPIVVAQERSWRGKPVSQMAAESAQRLRARMASATTEEATMLTFRGVSAINRNDWAAAKQDFLKAYSLDPESAFSLNNRGYVAEKEGDIETAQFYYSKARQGGNADTRIGLATEVFAQGKPLAAVASQNHSKVNDEIELYSQAARRQTGPVELIRRNNAAPAGPTTPAKPSQPAKPSAAPGNPVKPGASDAGSQIPN